MSEAENVTNLKKNLLNLQEEKEKLIKYLEDKKKHTQKLIDGDKQKVKPYGEENIIYRTYLNAYTDILNKVKGGK